MSKILSAALLLSFHFTLLAADCPKIFPGELNGRFLLHTRVSCGSGIEGLRTRIENVNGRTGYFFDRTCENEAISMPLMYDANPNLLIGTSSPVRSNETAFLVALECRSAPSGYVLYGNREINGKPVAIYSWSLNYPVPFGTAIAFQDEYHVDEITFRSMNNTVLAHAKKKTVRDPGPCYANWDVNYTGFDPLMIAYMLYWQRIENTTCPPTPPPTPTPNPSTSLIVLMSIIPVALFAMPLSTYFVCAYRDSIRAGCIGCSA